MWKIIPITFTILGVAFYQLSGGASYQPREGSLQAVAALKAQAPIQIATLERKSDPAVEITQVSQEGTAEAVVTRGAVNLADLPQIVDKSVQSDMTFIKASAPMIEVAAPLAEPTTEPEKIADIRTISGNNVNMRMGPGTRYNVVAKLRRETEVQVLQHPGNGWLKLRVVESGRVGWMAEFLVTAAN